MPDAPFGGARRNETGTDTPKGLCKGFAKETGLHALVGVPEPERSGMARIVSSKRLANRPWFRALTLCARPLRAQGIATSR